MDRYLRRDSTIDARRPRGWLRALVLASAVAGAGIGAGLAVPGSALAQAESGRTMSVPIADTAPERYVVKSGDTLWDISAMYLRDPWYWPEIWYVNPNIANPHLIYPGDVLYFSYVDGRPRVSLERAGAVRLSPEVRSSPLEDAIRAIPYDVLMNFAGRPRLLDKDEIKSAPYVVGMRDRHIVGTELNEVYGRGIENAAPGSHYNIIGIGDELRDPDDGDLLGYVGHYAAMGEVVQDTRAIIPAQQKRTMLGRLGLSRSEAADESLTHLKVLEINREILQGDKIFPAKVTVGNDFVMSIPKDEKLVGQIMAVVDGVSVAGRYQVLAINRGKRDGLEPGNALGVFYRGEDVRDHFDRSAWSRFTTSYDQVRLPDERSATVLVFQVYQRMSYALVMESSHVIHKGDFVAHPQLGHREMGDTNYMR